MPPRGNFDTPPSHLWRRNPLPHSCGTGVPHAFQTFKKMPPSLSSLSSTFTTQKSPPENYMDTLNSRAPLDMSTSTMQASPNDLSMRRCSTTSSEAGTSLTERLMRLVSTWDTAAVSSRNIPTLPPLPPPPPPPPQFLSPLLLSTQSDSSALLLNR